MIIFLLEYSHCSLSSMRIFDGKYICCTAMRVQSPGGGCECLHGGCPRPRPAGATTLTAASLPTTAQYLDSNNYYLLLSQLGML